MDTLQIFILSVVQGITELLPISSSAHLILIGKLLNFEIAGNLLFLTILHLGTTLAIIVFYRKTLFKNFFTKEKWIFFLKLLLASIPAAIAGFFLEEYISSTLHETKTIATSLIVVGLLFILFENLHKEGKKVKPEELSLLQMLAIGTGQALALIPGTSRSGVTTLTGMVLGLEKYSAFKFSFILGIPILLGSSFYELLFADLTSLPASLSLVEMVPFILITFIIGYLSLLLISRFKKKKWLTVFGVYRIVVGILILVLAI